MDQYYCSAGYCFTSLHFGVALHLVSTQVPMLQLSYHIFVFILCTLAAASFCPQLPAYSLIVKQRAKQEFQSISLTSVSQAVGWQMEMKPAAVKAHKTTLKHQDLSTQQKMWGIFFGCLELVTTTVGSVANWSGYELAK